MPPFRESFVMFVQASSSWLLRRHPSCGVLSCRPPALSAMLQVDYSRNLVAGSASGIPHYDLTVVSKHDVRIEPCALVCAMPTVDRKH